MIIRRQFKALSITKIQEAFNYKERLFNVTINIEKKFVY